MIKRTVLQLNQSFEPLRIVTPRRAVELVTRGKARVVVPTSIQIYPGVFVPSVIRLVTYAHVPYKRPVPSRKNIFTRDGGRCMYCGRRASRKNEIVLELEHVVPR